MVLIVAAVAALALREQAAISEQVLHGRRIATASQNVLTDLVNAETGQRGFLVAGESQYLEPLHDALRRIGGDTASLRTLTQGDSAQRSRVDSLLSLVGVKLGEMTLTVGIRRTFGFDSARSVVRTNVGKRTMDRIRDVLGAVDAREDSLLAARVRRERRQTRLVYLLLTLGAIAAIAVGALVNRVLLRAAARQTALASTVSEQNVQLEEQMMELEMRAEQLETQQHELEAANEELQSTSEELIERTVAAERAEAEAREANLAKSTFLATMSHELRTPLNAILGYASLLDLGVPEPLPPSAQAQVRRAQSAARHLLSLIEEVLTFSRLEVGREQIAVERIDVPALAHEVEAVITPLATQKGIRFTIDIASMPATMWTDPRKLRQILINLLGNAVKFTDRGSISLRCRPLADGDVAFEVRDTGVGIAEADQQMVFEPFWQVETTMAGRPAGSGLGLGLSRALAHLLGGEVSVVSELGVGSTFTVRLPVDARAVTAKAAGANR